MSRASEQDPFNVTSSTTLSKGEQLRRRFDLWVLSPLRIIWDDMRTRVGLAVLLLYVFVGTVGPLIVDQPSQNEGEALIPPFQSMQFPLGTDGLGAGIFEMVVHSTPAMLKMIFAGAVFTTIMATLIGTVSGYAGGRTDELLRGVMDVMMSLPGLPLVIVIAVALEPQNPFVVGFILSINAWAGLGRAIRAQVLAIREESYVEASRFLGLSTSTIIVKDILPNLMPYIMISFMQSARNVVFASVGLYYLGLLPFTVLNWGVMMNMARQRGSLTSWEAAHWLLAPMVAITLLTFGLIMFSQGMDRMFNPRVRARHAGTIKTDEDH